MEVVALADRCCETCRYDLGGGYNNCKINLEDECAAGNYEAWEAKRMQKPRNERDKVVAAVYRAQGVINMLYEMASQKIGFGCGEAIDDTIAALEEIIDMWDDEFNESEEE